MLGYCMTTLLIVLAIPLPQDTYATWFGSRTHGLAALTYFIIFTSLFAASFGGMHYLLHSEKSNAYLDRIV